MHGTFDLCSLSWHLSWRSPRQATFHNMPVAFATAIIEPDQYIPLGREYQSCSSNAGRPLLVDEPKIVRLTLEWHSSCESLWTRQCKGIIWEQELGGFRSAEVGPRILTPRKSDCRNGSENGCVKHVGHWHSWRQGDWRLCHALLSHVWP